MTFALRKSLTTFIPSRYFLIGLLTGIMIGIMIILPIGEQDFNYFRFSTNEGYLVNVGEHKESTHNNSLDFSLSRKLYDEVKVLCWIMTGPKTHKTKAIHIKATWGRRCNHLLFMSTQEDPLLPSIALPVKEDRANLWGKTKEAFKYVHNNYLDKADWFFKADDDTYTVMENMRYMLHYHNKSDPVYFGFRFKPLVKQGYMSGGSGYVLSKEALRRFVEESLPDPNKCKLENTGAEDAEIGKCLEAVGVKPGDSRDNFGRTTFIPLFVNDLLLPGKLPNDFWFWSYVYYPVKAGLECCSDSLISVHYVSPENLYLLEYLIYHVRPFGLSYNASFDDPSFGNDTNEMTTYFNTTNIVPVKMT